MKRIEMMMIMPTIRRVGIALAFALLLSTAKAADVNGRIKGTVTDPVGAVVVKATVVATNTATGVKFNTTSQANGDYLFAQLPIGTYSITVTATGFKTFSATGIVLNIDQAYVEPVQLSVGSTMERVEVQADAVQVNTTDQQLSNIVDAAQIVEYPLIGRAFTQLEQILPGVQASDDRFTGNYSVNGSETQQSSYLINGADTNDFTLNTITFQPSVDALDQFNLVTGPLNAEYSRNSGAIVSAVVKQGTNQFHGDIYEFYRDTFLNNGNFFSYNTITNTKSVPVFHQNLFGGTLGGPILRNKLFIFGSYQGNRARQPGNPSQENTTVPTTAERGGNFTASSFTGNTTHTPSSNFIPGTVSIPGCVSGVDTFAACFARLGGILPTTAFNTISSALLSAYIPAPNSGTNKYAFNTTTNLVQDQAILRLDFNPTSKDQIDFIGIYQHQPTLDSLAFSGPTLPGFGDKSTSETRQLTFQYTRQISVSAVNQFAIHYTRLNFASTSPQNVIAPSSLGFAINPQDTAGQSVPNIRLTGGFNMGFTTNGPQPRIDQNYQVDDSFSWTIGRHSFKFGYDGRRFNVDNEFDSSNSGAYSFSSTSSTTNPSTSGNVFLDFELGIPASYSQTSNGRISAVSYENYAYAQDTWKATSTLTLNYGIGYQVDSAIHNRQYGDEGVNCFVPGQQSKVFPTAPLSLGFPGDPGCNDAQGATTPYSDWGPRFGFAYAPDLGGASHKLSLRGGVGIYYNRTEEEGSLQNLNQAPYGFTSSGIADGGIIAGQTKLPHPTFANPYKDIKTGNTITNPFPAALPKVGSSAVTFVGTPLYVSQYAPGYRAPYAVNFQLTVERELPGQMVATASYVGSVARRNQQTVEGNPITAAGHAACLADPGCIGNQADQEILYPTHTLYPQAINPATGFTHFYSDGLIATEGSSNYDALELSIHKGTTHGLAGQVSYTYSHALDNASSFEGSGFGIERGYNQYQTGLNYGNSDYDTRHRLVIAPIYAIPFNVTGSAFSARNLLAAGWEISAITTFATGHPFDISYLGGESYALYCSINDFYYTCPDVPNQVAPLKRFNPHNTTAAIKGQLFDGNINTAGASFTDETTGSFGNIGRNKYFGRGIDNTNLQISKNIRYSAEHTERIIQLRLESYNVFNHTNFNEPNGNPDNGTSIFGVISTAATARQTQLSGKLYF